MPILAAGGHRILVNLIALHANKVQTAFLFDVVRSMQLSQGQVGAKHFHPPSAGSAGGEAVTDFSVSVMQRPGIGKIRGFYLLECLLL